MNDILLSPKRSILFLLYQILLYTAMHLSFLTLQTARHFIKQFINNLFKYLSIY